jgi:Lysyl oxidase
MFKHLALASLLVASVGCLEKPQNLLAKKEIVFQGKAKYENGSTVDPQGMDIELQLEGQGFFANSDSSVCRGLDHHMGAGQEVGSVIDNQAFYNVTILAGDFAALVDAECKVAPDIEAATIDNLSLDAAIPATQANCTDFCRASVPTSGYMECVNTCATGDRRISGRVNISKEKLVAASKGNSIQFKEDIIFYSLSSPIRVLNGPDLQVDAPSAKNSMRLETKTFESSSCAIFEGCVGGPGPRKLLRFDGVIKNMGDADFILGDPLTSPELFTFSACHGHHHLNEAMSYELLDENLNPVKRNGASVVGHKQGFCMLDMRKASGTAGERKYTCSNQGLGSGWGDVYASTLDCQWIDVTDVPNGKYVVKVTVNPGGTLTEADKTNNSAFVEYTIK